MNIRIWTEQEKQYLRENYRDTTLMDLGLHFRVAPSTVYHQLCLMGLKKVSYKHNRRVWTKEELDYLRENFANTSAIDLADHFGCSNTTVSNKAKELGLEKSPEWKKIDYKGRYVNHYSGKKLNRVVV